MCPICKTTEETRDHYNYDYKQLAIFRKKIANLIEEEDFTKEQWTLNDKSNQNTTNILIAKARWIYHCERCNVDHNK